MTDLLFCFVFLNKKSPVQRSQLSCAEQRFCLANVHVCAFFTAQDSKHTPALSLPGRFVLWAHQPRLQRVARLEMNWTVMLAKATLHVGPHSLSLVLAELLRNESWKVSSSVFQLNEPCAAMADLGISILTNSQPSVLQIRSRYYPTTCFFKQTNKNK